MRFAPPYIIVSMYSTSGLAFNSANHQAVQLAVHGLVRGMVIARHPVFLLVASMRRIPFHSPIELYVGHLFHQEVRHAGLGKVEFSSMMRNPTACCSVW